jgi:hypothetical protein
VTRGLQGDENFSPGIRYSQVPLPKLMVRASGCNHQYGAAANTAVKRPSVSSIGSVISIESLEWGGAMKLVSVAAVIAVAIALGGCFQTLVNQYEVYPNDPSLRPCKVASDCTTDGGGA